MRQYLELQRRVLSEGKPQFNERTGQHMLLKAGDQSYYNLSDEFPIVTTKPVSIRWVAEELFWMLRGETEACKLYANGVNIWNRNAFQNYLDKQGFDSDVPKNTPLWNEFFRIYESAMKENQYFEVRKNSSVVEPIIVNDKPFNPAFSDLGPIYGEQWRRWKKYQGETIDQIKKLIDGIKKEPGSRYHVLSAWNVSQLEEMAIKPCHPISHFTVSRNKDLEVHMFQRSCDLFLGVPFNISQYALLSKLIAQETEMNPIGFYHTYSNVHLYTGVSPRSDFLANKNNLRNLQTKVKEASKLDDFLEIKKWYIDHAPAESLGNERKDQVPFVLEQMSKSCQPLPKIKIKNMPLFNIIKESAKDVIELEGYSPLNWDCKSVMAT